MLVPIYRQHPSMAPLARLVPKQVRDKRGRGHAATTRPSGVTRRSKPINQATGYTIHQLGRRSGLSPQGKSQSAEGQSRIKRVVVDLTRGVLDLRAHARVRHPTTRGTQ